jgi:ABC-type multidrug transport system ATPase subunit
MIQWIEIKNFKQFENVHIDLGSTVVFIGPNNSGKTSALQALSLWHLGLRRWREKRGPEFRANQRSGVAVNRRDLSAIPTPSGKLIWRNLNVRRSFLEDSRTKTEHVLIEITVGGVTKATEWTCGLLFDYTNEESFYVRPTLHDDQGQFLRELALAGETEVAYMPPMSGLASNENLLLTGAINVLIGQGQTAQVLRNLCYLMQTERPDEWSYVKLKVDSLFGCTLYDPRLITERGEISLTYRSRSAQSDLDISSAGRGLQQTLLLLTYIGLNPGSILLLDEPDAHLEVLRQRQVFALIRQYAEKCGSQIIAASHSEVILNDVVNTGRVIAFVGKPHDLTDNASQLKKSLTSIGWEDYFLAEQKGWLLYVEDSTDLRILQEFARILDHPVQKHLEQCFVFYIGSNVPSKAREHFYGLREAKGDLVGFALFDRLDQGLANTTELVERMWSRREIENYFASREVLMRWVGNAADHDLFSLANQEEEMSAMRQAIQEVESAQRTLGRDTWSNDSKASDDVLDPIFRRYFEILERPLEFRKTSYSDLVRLLERSEVSGEVSVMLTEIQLVAERARTVEAL